MYHQIFLPKHTFFLHLQLQNDLLQSHCIDEGTVPGNIPLLYGCHFYQPQVCLYSVYVSVYYIILCHKIRSPRLLTASYPQQCYYNTDGEIYVGGIKSHKYNNNRCLVDPGTGNIPTLHDCKLAAERGLHKHWDFQQVACNQTCGSRSYILELSSGAGFP